jgi:transposase-like protein
MNRYSSEVKTQVLNEIKEVGSVLAVARKHGISDKTIGNWLRAARNKDVNDANKSVRQLEKTIAEQEKQIEVLKSLLKKTYQVWNSEDEPLKNL